MSRRSLGAPAHLRPAVLAGLAAALVALACNGGAPAPIYLAAVYNTSGAQAVLDVPSANGSRLKVDQLNGAGGVAGRQLTLVPVDGDSQPPTLLNGVDKALSDNPDIAALLGLSDTDMVLAAAPVAAAHGRVFLTSGATSPKLPAQVPDWLYLACFGDNVQAAAAAEFAYDQLHVRSAMILYDPNTTYTQLLQGYFEQRFTQLGGTVTSVVTIDPRSGQVTPPAPGSVDMVFLAVETAQDAVAVVPALRAGGFSGPVMGGDGYDAAPVWSAAAETRDVFFTTHVYLGRDNPDPIVGAFLDAYAAAYPDQAPSAFSALGYDAVGLLAAAIQKAGKATPDGLAQALGSMRDYAGVTGKISFGDGNRIPTKSVAVVKVEGGRLSLAAEVVPQAVPDP